MTTWKTKDFRTTLVVAISFTCCSVFAQAPPIKPPMPPKMVGAPARGITQVPRPATGVNNVARPNATGTGTKATVQKAAVQRFNANAINQQRALANQAISTNALSSSLNLNGAATLNGNSVNNGFNSNVNGLNSNLNGTTANAPQGLTTNQPVMGSLKSPLEGTLNQNALSNTSGISSNLQQKLNLNGSQTSQINAFQNSYNQELRELNNRFQSDPQGTQSLATQAGQQLQQQVNSVLTPQQRLSLTQATGVPDTFSGSALTTGTNGISGNTVAGNANNMSRLNAFGGTTSSLALSQQAKLIQSQAISAFGQSNSASLIDRNFGAQPLKLGNGGFVGISNPNVQNALQLNSSQVSQLQKFQADYVQQLGSLSGRFQSDPQGTLNLYNSALQRSNTQIESVLTPQQRQTLSTLTGTPSTLSNTTP